MSRCFATPRAICCRDSRAGDTSALRRTYGLPRRASHCWGRQSAHTTTSIARQTIAFVEDATRIRGVRLGGGTIRQPPRKGGAVVDRHDVIAFRTPYLLPSGPLACGIHARDRSRAAARQPPWLLEDDQRPLLDRMARLLDQLLLRGRPATSEVVL